MSEENNYRVLMMRVYILLVLAVLNIVVGAINIFFSDSYLIGAIGIFVFCVCMWAALAINKRAQQSVLRNRPSADVDDKTFQAALGSMSR